MMSMRPRRTLTQCEMTVNSRASFGGNSGVGTVANACFITLMPATLAKSEHPVSTC